VDNAFVYNYLEKKFKAIVKRLDKMELLISENSKGISAMSAETQELAEKIATLTTVVGSVEVLITTLVADIQEHADDPAAIRQIAADVQSDIDRLTSAVVANTPSA